MVKRVVSYDAMRDYTLEVLDFQEDAEYDCVLAISRGGLTIAQLIAKDLHLPIAVYSPDGNKFQTGKIDLDVERVLVVDDLIAEGRTYKEITDKLKDAEIAFDYFAYVLDADSPVSKDDVIYVENTTDWIVFPWENEEDVTENDRGLFRENTDEYGK